MENAKEGDKKAVGEVAAPAEDDAAGDSDY